MNNLKKIAEARGYTIASLSKETGIDETLITLYWNDAAPCIVMRELEILCRFFDVHADSLLMPEGETAFLMTDKFSD